MNDYYSKKKKKFTWHFVLRHCNLQEGTEVTVCRICIRNVSVRKGEAVNKIFFIITYYQGITVIVNFIKEKILQGKLL